MSDEEDMAVDTIKKLIDLEYNDWLDSNHVMDDSTVYGHYENELRHRGYDVDWLTPAEIEMIAKMENIDNGPR